MASVFIYKIDSVGDHQLVGTAETQEQALAEAIRKHEKQPCHEYRIINPNFGVVGVIAARSCSAALTTPDGKS